MPRLHQILVTGVALAALAACAESSRDIKVANAEPPAPVVAPEPGPPPEALTAVDVRSLPAEEVVVSGSRIPGKMAPMARTRAPAMMAPGYMPDRRLPPYYRDEGRDRFTAFSENPFKVAKQDPVSTFSIDVDTAAYSFVRASLSRNVLPQPAAVRTEEMVNYFPYDYAAPRSTAQPFATDIALYPSPFTPGRQMVRIAIKGHEVQRATRPRANLVFLVDTSGSMDEPNKLPLVKQSLGLLLETLDARDSVAIVAYAGLAGTVLEPTRGNEKAKIRAAIDRLGAGGGTAGAEGIRQAYALAEQNFAADSVNRVMLATDGDFNIGVRNTDELKGVIERERTKGIFLSVLGFGMGNYNDALMQALAQNGNGTAAYIDTIGEARKTLVEEASSTLFPIAKDVKIQVEFNPARVAEYRLIGYETRALNREDFDNDKVDAGEVGSGQSVTAIYEIVPVGGPLANGTLRYAGEVAAPASRDGELGYVKIRYKLPKSDTSRLISTPIEARSAVARFQDAPREARFATAVAGFAELLRGGKHSGALSYDDVIAMALAARGDDPFGYRAGFVDLVRTAKTARSLAAR
ncbi:VWA domain-containing protein [Nostoc sp. 3335mG]|nr:VWA domain-containing protein [Nostoc sp. 3335mG]